VLRQNSIRAENRAIPCRDNLKRKPGWDLRARRLSTGGSIPRGVPVYIRIEGPWRFRDAPLVRIRQPDRTGSAALPVAHEKGRDLRLCGEFFRLAFPSRVRDACGPRGSSEYTQRSSPWMRGAPPEVMVRESGNAQR
jgi:hypothetical protein